MIRPLVCIFLVCGLLIYTNAQPSHKIDSLTQLLDETHEVGKKIDAYLELTEIYHRIDLDTATIYAQRALTLAQEIGSKKHVAAAYFHMGTIAVKRDSLDTAFWSYQKAIDYYRSSENLKRLCDALIIIGNIYLTKGNYPGAMENYMEVNGLLEICNYESVRPHVHNNMANVYFLMGDNKQALAHFSKAHELFERDHDTMNMAITISNLGALYADFDEISTAKKYTLQALGLSKQLAHYRGQVTALAQLANLYNVQNQPDSAIFYLEKALNIHHKIGFEFFGPRSIDLANIHAYMGKAFLLKSDLKNALTHSLKSFDIAMQIKQNQALKDISEQISSIYREKNIVDSSYAFYMLFKAYSDSIISENNIKKLAQIELQFKLGQQAKEKELADKLDQLKQRRKNLIYIIVFGCLLFGIIVFFLLFRLEKAKKTKAEIDRLQLQKELDFKNKELTTHVLYVLKKNEFMLNIAEKLRSVIPQIKVQNKKPIAEIVRELDDGSADTIWEEFELRFQQVHTSFFEKLSKAYPALSSSELRMCALLRLNLSTKEIVSITYQSVKSVEMTRFRLRKKLGLEKDENLISFLNQY